MLGMLAFGVKRSDWKGAVVGGGGRRWLKFSGGGGWTGKCLWGEVSGR